MHPKGLLPSRHVLTFPKTEHFDGSLAFLHTKNDIRHRIQPANRDVGMLRQAGGSRARWAVSAPARGIGISVGLDFHCWSATCDFSSSFSLVVTLERTERFAFLTVMFLKKALWFRTNCCFCNVNGADKSGNSRPGVAWREDVAHVNGLFRDRS